MVIFAQNLYRVTVEHHRLKLINITKIDKNTTKSSILGAIPKGGIGLTAKVQIKAQEKAFMSDWMEELVAQAKTDEFNCYLDLFEFNGFNPPKFWFGDEVECFGKRSVRGKILGLEWRDGIDIMPRGGSQNSGWWYQICLEGRQSLQGFHEDSLAYALPF